MLSNIAHTQFIRDRSQTTLTRRAVGRSENPGVLVLFGGHNLPPLVEIGLNDLPKSGGAMAPPATPGTTGLLFNVACVGRRDGRSDGLYYKMQILARFSKAAKDYIMYHIYFEIILKLN